jgi:hypothetical protein
MTKTLTNADVSFRIELINDLVSDLKEYHAMSLLGTSARVRMSLTLLKKKTLENIHANLEKINDTKEDRFKASLRLIREVLKEYE